MSTNQKKEWEKEFDTNVENLPVYLKEVEQFFKENPDSLYGEDVYPETILELSPEKIKAFIQSLLHSRNESLVEKLEGVRPCRFQCCCELCALSSEDTSIHCGDCVMDKPITAIKRAQEIIRNQE